ncbi:MAG: GNAT family N-acetyltransferase [Gammaproteobacteria bacterium]
MDIQHESQRQRFVVTMDGLESVLEYRLRDDSIDFTRTFVPEALRGRGIAEKLVRTGIAWAREQGYAMQASCWYAKRFLERGRKGG